jgi:hypothetical protein
MADSDLRPLSLGEMLDRTFSLYRRHFWLFMGINAVPQLLILALNLTQTWVGGPKAKSPVPIGQAPGAISGGLAVVGILAVLIGIVVYLAAYLFAQGGTVHALSDVYLGRPTSVRGSLERMRGHAANLFGVSLLSGLATVAGLILLIVPGIYVACRLLASVPAAVLENLGPSESLSRSWNLTKDYAGRSFVIYVLYIVLLIAATALFAFPFSFAAGLAARDPGMARLWLGWAQLGNFVANVLVVPFFTIATSVFYLDLRVRKEALDLQLMLNPGAVAGSAKVASMFT